MLKTTQKDKDKKELTIKYKKLRDIPELVVDIKSDLADWHAVKSELLKVKQN